MPALVHVNSTLSSHTSQLIWQEADHNITLPAPESSECSNLLCFLLRSYRTSEKNEETSNIQGISILKFIHTCVADCYFIKTGMPLIHSAPEQSVRTSEMRAVCLRFSRQVILIFCFLFKIAKKRINSGQKRNTLHQFLKLCFGLQISQSE